MHKEIDWQGAFWIGVPNSQYKERKQGARIETEVAYFRHTFTLDRPGHLELSISASTRYRLWINGQAVLSGPCKSDRWKKYYETIDVSNYLHSGENIIAAKVVAFPPYEVQDGDNRGPFWAVSNAAGPCLIVKGACMDDSGTVLSDITTGLAQWSVCLDEAVNWHINYISLWMGSMETVQGCKLPFGWADSENPEGSWVRAAKKWSTERSMFGEIIPFPLQARPIPFLYELEKEFVCEMPIRKDDLQPFTFKNKNRKAVLKPNTRNVIELNAGELTTGYFALGMEGGKSSSITIRYTESYVKRIGDKIEKGIRDDAANGVILGHEDIYYPSGRQETYEPFWFRTFRFVRIEVEVGEEELALYSPVYRETGYPLDVVTNIDASADWIKPLWDISLRTLQRCMHETYEDCPYYEQLQYTMDTRLQMIFTYILSGDTRMALRTIEDFHSSLLPEGILQSRYPSNLSQVIPDFSLHWIFMLEDYYLQTGDSSIPRRYRPTVDAILDYYDRKLGPQGLVEYLGYWDQADWVEEWADIAGTPRAALYGPSTIHNLVYAYALKTAARLARLTGRPGVAVEYELRAGSILERVEALCWSEKEGMYMEGPGFEEYTQHAQVWAVLSGLAEGERARGIMQQAITRKEIAQCSFPLLFYLFRALEKAGLYSETEEQWEKWKCLLPLHLTTVPEVPFKPRSDCHAWGALPLYEFTRNILGINPSAAGWESVLIAPKPLSLPDAGGQVITPKGLVKVEWSNTKDGFHIKGEIPAGVSAEILMPDGSKHTLPKGGWFEF